MKDLLCHDIVAPTNDIDNVGFLQIPNMSQTQVAGRSWRSASSTRTW